MAQFSDSLIDSVAKVVLGVLRRSDTVDYRALYGATILFSDGQKATVRPDIAALGPSLSDCRVRRPDGYSATPTAGTACLVGWEGGDPSKRYVLLGALDGTATDVRIKATTARVEASTTLDLLGLTVNAGTTPATGAVATQAFVTAVNVMFGAVAVYTAAVAVVLPVTAPAAAALAAAYATFTGALATYQTTRFKAT